MKNLKLAFFAALIFMVSTAENCQKRDPLVELGSTNNPDAIGTPEASKGAFDVYVRDGGVPVPNVEIKMYLNAMDAEKKQNIYRTYTSTDSFSKVRNVFAGRTYYFTAGYQDPSGAPKSGEVNVAAGTTDLPATVNVDVK